MILSISLKHLRLFADMILPTTPDGCCLLESNYSCFNFRLDYRNLYIILGLGLLLLGLGLGKGLVTLGLVLGLG